MCPAYYDLLFVMSVSWMFAAMGRVITLKSAKEPKPLLQNSMYFLFPHIDWMVLLKRFMQTQKGQRDKNTSKRFLAQDYM